MGTGADKMKPKIILDAAINEILFTGRTPFAPDFITLDFTPFCQRSVNEASARRIKTALDPKTKLIGVFSDATVNQILYLFTENILDLALCPKLSERDLRRIAETTRKPLIRAVDSPKSAAIEQAARLTGTYLYITKLPEREVLKKFSKPYILPVSYADRDILPTINENYAPFALWLTNTTPTEIEKLIEIIDSIYK